MQLGVTDEQGSQIMAKKTQKLKHEHIKNQRDQEFVEKTKMQVEDRMEDFEIDFESWNINTNGIGYVNIWVEPKIKVIYLSLYKFSIPKIEIKGLQITIKTKLLAIKPKCKIHSFEISDSLNPNEWCRRFTINCFYSL